MLGASAKADSKSLTEKGEPQPPTGHPHTSLRPLSQTGVRARGGEIALIIGLIGPRGAFWLCLRAIMGPSAIRIETKTLKTNTNAIRLPIGIAKPDRSGGNFAQGCRIRMRQLWAMRHPSESVSARPRPARCGPCTRKGRNPLSSNKCRRAWSQDQLRPSPMPESAHTPSGAHTAQYRGRSVEGVREDAWRELCAQLVEDEDGAYLA